jgi:hypothetical protein
LVDKNKDKKLLQKDRKIIITIIIILSVLYLLNLYLVYLFE